MVADTTRNTETFRAVWTALAAGKAICLFPEGPSHDHGHLAPLRTGAARITLSAGRAGEPVTVVPVGLNFEHVSSFRRFGIRDRDVETLHRSSGVDLRCAQERSRGRLRSGGVRAFLALRRTPLRARAQLKRQRASPATILEQIAGGSGTKTVGVDYSPS